jgi:uncharacterized protein YdhG (YjbR/CyaY superfamily)
MQYSAETPQDYLEQLDDDWRRQKLLQIRNLIKSAEPSIEKHIHYKMLGYALDGEFFFHLNAQRNYVSLYLCDATKIDPEGELLTGLSVGKGCVRFTKTKLVENSRIDEFLQKAVALKKSGVEFEC